MRFLPVNETVFITELEDLDQTLRLFASLSHEKIAAIREIIPAAHTLMIAFEPALTSLPALIKAIRGRNLGATLERATRTIEIPVVYNGQDLREVADILDISQEEVIRRHTASNYSVAFTGFAPGFAYLAGGDPVFDVPRRKTPRTRIPAGSVGLAGTFSGIYPQPSPGGWQLIGTTDLAMFDIARTPPALLQPGNRVKFVDADGRKIATPAKAATAATVNKTQQTGSAALRVKSVAMPVLFQDSGRIGQASQGVSPSGAIDRGAMHTANRLVGNKADDVVLEITFGGLSVEVLAPSVIALTGATCPVKITTSEGRTISFNVNQAFAVEKGDVITLGTPDSGLRSYLAIRGGFNVEKILGSSARDTLANLGPEPLENGDILYVRTDRHPTVVALDASPAFIMPKAGETITLDVIMGPRTDWFTSEAIKLFLSQKWEVTPQSNRVGNRLQGEQPLSRKITQELPSEGTATGAIQVPASGQPVLFLADHPLTGGYPVIATVADHHLDLAGQLPVGAMVCFRAIVPFAELGDSNKF